ncbi:DUF2550 domain-containing protein [Cellulomonas fimi]|uniref:DUF2550 domain-containing protein n=1 Tax=Cellulomonas fimi TaxID=1708 RepID=UPI002892A8BB|nr:DUF2550 domain-containing protein [Cellulomonas fimi]
MALTIVEVAVGALVLAVVVTFGLGASRLRTLSGRVGSFVCAARPAQPPGGAWSAGIAQYGAGRLDWWRSWSLSPRPARSWERSELEVLGRDSMEAAGRPDLYLVRCRHRDAELELTMSPGAYAGLTSWLEAAPPSDVARLV